MTTQDVEFSADEEAMLERFEDWMAGFGPEEVERLPRQHVASLLLAAFARGWKDGQAAAKQSAIVEG